MGIDRKRVEELKGRTEPVAMVVKDTAGLVRAFAACRTAGELAALDRKFNRHCRVTGLKLDAMDTRRRVRRGGKPVWFGPISRPVSESEALCLLAYALAGVRFMPEDDPLPDDFWIQSWRDFQVD